MEMAIQNSSLIFENIKIHPGMTETEFLPLENSGKIIRRASNEGWTSYSFLYALGEQTYYALLLSFYDGLIKTVTVGIGHPGSTWDDETPERIQEDGRKLQAVMYALFGNTNNEQQYNWGKVELWQDFKNAFKYSIIVTYV